MVRVYVTSPIRFREETAELNKNLEENGHEIVRDWTSTSLMTSSLFRQRKLNNINDEKAIRMADVLVVLLPDTTFKGVLVDVGMAIALKKRIVILSPWSDPTGTRRVKDVGDVFKTGALARAEKFVNTTKELVEYLA